MVLRFQALHQDQPDLADQVMAKMTGTHRKEKLVGALGTGTERAIELLEVLKQGSHSSEGIPGQASNAVPSHRTEQRPFGQSAQKLAMNQQGIGRQNFVWAQRMTALAGRRMLENGIKVSEEDIEEATSEGVQAMVDCQNGMRVEGGEQGAQAACWKAIVRSLKKKHLNRAGDKTAEAALALLEEHNKIFGSYTSPALADGKDKKVAGVARNLAPTAVSKATHEGRALKRAHKAASPSGRKGKPAGRSGKRPKK
jgi:hypothetical protein